MESYILHEGALNDDTIHIANTGKVFKGGYIAVIEYFKYQNNWSNSKHFVRFRSEVKMNEFIQKNYPNFNF